MRLGRFHFHHIRNFKDVTLIPHPRLNIFWGSNGAGKTSLLEAIHLLAMGRSFRTRQIQTVIAHHQHTLACYGEILCSDGLKIPLGIEKNRRGEVKCKMRGEPCERLSTFAAALPLQLITPETFELLNAGPQERRRFLDWGMFHVEPSFAGLCQRYHRLLKQRNAALKQAISWHYLQGWEKELAVVGEQISNHRQRYVTGLLSFVEDARQHLLPSLDLTFTYEQGW